MDNGVDQRKRLQHVSMDERGITMLHFALVLPLLFLLVVAILDLCYFLTVESVLDAAVHRALARALSVPNLDVSPIGADPDSHGFRRLVMAREKSTGEGIAFLRETGLIRTDGPAPGQARGTRLLTVTHTEDRTAGRPVTFEAGVMVLLPGECAWIAELERTECNRETLGTTSEAPPPMQPPAFLMESHPVGSLPRRGWTVTCRSASPPTWSRCGPTATGSRSCRGRSRRSRTRSSSPRDLPRPGRPRGHPG